MNLGRQNLNTLSEHDVDDWDKGKDDLIDDEERVDYPRSPLR